jgi:hypothetical protein
MEGGEPGEDRVMNEPPSPQPASPPGSRNKDRNLIVALVVFGLIVFAFLLLAGIVGMTP